MRQATVLGFLACFLAMASMATAQARQNVSSPTLLGHPLHVDALGAPKPNAPLARRQARGVRVKIDRSGFEVSGPKTSVSLSGLDTGRAGWARFARGASRRTPFGRETIVVAPQKTEQFLTVDRRQGKRTWRWRLDSPGISPRVGDDGAVAFRSGHTLAGTHIEPVGILDGEGRDVTPDGLRWSLAKDRGGWLLELRLDDSELPVPYVIDPAVITLRSAATVVSSSSNVASLTAYKPIGIQQNDLMLASILIHGSRTITAPLGWNQVRHDQQGTNLTQDIWYKVAGPNEPGSYQFSFSGSDKPIIGILPYVGVDNSSPIDTSSGNPSTANSALVRALSVTTSSANHVVVGFFGLNKTSSFTPDGTMTEEWDRSTSATTLEGADYTAAAGATGDKIATAANSAAWIGQLVALKLDTAPPTQTLSVTEGTRPDLQYFDSAASTMYYNPAAAGDFTVASTITDAGASQVTFPAISATGFMHTAAYRGQVLADEPLAYWRLGESSGTSAADASGNGNTGTYTGSPTLGAAGALAPDSDTATSFDGVDDYVTVPNNASLNLNGSFSIEFWAKQTAFANTWPGILNKGTSANANGYLIWASSTGQVDLKRNNQSAQSAAGALTASYKHFVVTYDGTNVRWYVNGALSTTTARAYPSNASTAALTIALGDAGQYANDVIDDVAIYQTALSQTRISEHYNVGISSSRDEIDTASPFTSANYSFTTANTTAPAASTITGLDGASSSVTTNLTFVRDVTAPTGMSATVTGGYYTSLSVPVTLNNGSDTESGVDATTGIVERDEVALANDSCPAFTDAWSTVTLSGGNDTTVQSGKCYRYRYKISDRVGNESTQAGTSLTAKVDTSAPTPAPTLNYGSFSNAALAGGVVYYRPSAASGQFDVTASGSADPESGISGYSFPAAAGGWSRSIAGATATYSHTGSPTDPAEPNDVTAQNNAGLASSATSFTVTPDSSAPTGHSVALSGGPYYSSLSVALTPTDGSDTGAGVDSSSRVYERDTGTLSNGSCAGFPGTWAATVSNPDTTVVSGNCYRYRLKISDLVGNQSAPSLASADAMIDTSAPSDPTFTYGSFSNAAVAGGVVYYGPGASSGQFAVTADSTDGQSGIAGYTFPAAAAGWSRSIAGATATYSHTGSPADPAEPNNVTAQNNAGLSSNATSFTVTPDSSLPASSIQCGGAACSAGWYTSSPVSVTLSASDTGSGVSEIKYTTDGSDPTLTNGTVYSGAFSLAATATVKYRAWDNVGNAEAVQSKLIQIDATAPTAPTFSFSSLTNAAATGQTVYFRSGVAGGVTVTASSSDPESGVASYAFPALGSGWSGSQAGASYSYSFTNAAADPAEPNDVTATNGAGLTSNPGSFTVTADGAAPVSSIQCNGAACSGGWYTSSPVSVSLSASDVASGVQEIRYTTDGSDPSPVNGTVYSAPFNVLVTTTVKFRAYDRVGNEEAVGSQLVQVDTSAPTGPALTLAESPTSPNQHVSGTTLYYNPQGSNSGSFTVDAATSDPESGVEKVTYPAVTGMTGGGDDPASPYQGSYSWTASTTGSGAQTVTARNNATLTSTANFTVTPDTTAPGSQTAALVGGPYYTSASVGFTTGDGSDSGSGLDTSSRLVERASATLANGSCAGFGVFGGSYSSPDTSVVSDNCYRYRFTIADQVGNVSTAVVTADAKVDTSAPTATMGDPGANLRGTVSLTSTVSDPESGIATTTYQRSPAGQGIWTATPASWDTTGVADGLYDLRVVVTNGAGTSTTSAVVINRRVDNTAPAATMDNPGSPLSNTVTLTATASDTNGSGLNTATFQYSYQGTGPWTTIGTDPSAPFSVNWDTTTVGDGRYSLRVIVTDVAGNSTTSAVVANRQVQNHPPIVTITNPETYLNGSAPSPFTITATAIGDNAGVANVEFFRCDNSSLNCSTGNYVSLGIDPSDPYSASWDLAAEPEGNRTLKAIVTDVNTSTGNDVLNVTIDRTAPTGSITAPGVGAYVGGTTVAVSSDSADALSGVAQVVFQRSPAGAGTWTAIDTDANSPYTVTWSTTSLSDGAYDLRAVTSDAAGNVFNGPTRTVNVDNTGPTATQDDPGANLRASVSLTASAADPAGVAQVVFQRSPAGQGNWTAIDTDPTFPYATTFDTTTVADGLYDFRVVATDSLGNPTSSAAVVNRRVDNTSPSATQDDPGANLRASVTLTGSASDTGGSGIAQVTFERSPAGAGTWTAIGTDPSAPYSTSFDTTGVSDGLYDLRAVATDNAGNVANSSLVVNRRVDNTPPSATMDDPGANLSGTVSLTSVTSDTGGSGIASVTYQYSPAGQSTWTTTPASWNTTLVGDGLYDLRVIATDNAGNSTTSAAVVNRRVDNGAPEVTITSPATYVNGGAPDPFTVTASSPDSDLSGVEFFACDNASTGCSTGNWVSLGTDPNAPYSASWALPGADGNRALRAVATDLASNTGQNVKNTLVDRAAPSGGSVGYLDGYETTGSLTITTSDGTDSGSGLDAASGVIQRDVVALSDGSCGSFAGSWSAVTSPDSVANGNCVRYRYRISDLAGNVATYTSVNVAKVDISAPSTPTFAFSALTNAVASGQTVYFRVGIAGGFTVTASSSDAQSGIASYAFPALGSGWSASQTGASDAYSFSSSAADPAEPNDVSVQNNAGLTSNPASFTVTADGTAPVSSIACDGGACSGGWYTSSVSVSLSAADAASGLQEIRYTTDGSDPSPINGTVYSAPFNVSATTTVKFRAYDRLGNEEPVASQLVQVDTSAPAAPVLSYGSFQNAVLAGGVVWYRPSAASGQFAVTASSSDNESGIAGYTFPAAAGGWSRSIGGATATYSHSGSPADPAEPNDVTAQNNAGLSSGPTSFTANADGTAPATSIACDGAACSAGWYTSAVSVSLSAGDAGSGLAEIRYTTDGSDPSPSNGTVYSGAFAVASTTTVRYRAYDLLGNEEGVGQQLVRIDSSAPAAPVLSLSESPASPNQHHAGTTLFYNPQGSNSGSFTVDAAASDPGSGIDRVSFASLTGMTGGGDDFLGPYEATYDWSASSSASGAQSVVARNNAGLTSSASFTVTPDTTAPTGQTIDNDGGPYYTTLSVPLTITNGSDSGSGLDTSSGVVQRDSAALANDGCASWSGWSTVTLVGGEDTSVVSGNCYRYRYLISDNVGNQSSPSALSGTAKVDTSAPSAPTFSFSALTNAAASGQTVYFRSGAAGGFTVTASSDDAETGIASYAFPALGSGWSDTPSGASDALSFSSSAADPVEPNDATAQNNAGLTSNPASFTVTADGTAPVSSIACDGGACSGGWYTSAVSVSLSATDAASGVQEIRYTTDGSDPSPINGTVYSAPFGVSATTTVKFRAYDRVGNEEQPVGSQLIRVDTSAPAAPALTLSESPASPNQHVSGSTLFYNPQGGNAGSFTVDASTSDPDSGIDRVTFPALGGMTGGGDDPSSPYQDSYSWTSASTASGSQTVTARNNAGGASTASFTVTPDTAPPTGGSVSYPNGYASGSVTITTADGSDALSGVDATTGVIERDSTNLVAGVCDPFPGSWSTVTSPDSTIVSGNCYRYRYRVSDRVGNNAVHTSPNVVKVSSTAPSAPSLTLAEAPGSPNQHVAGTTLFYNPQGGNTGTFAVTADVADSGGSGIERVSFPSLSGITGGGDDFSSPYQGSYDWNAGGSATGPQTVTVYNNAGLTSSATFTVTPDTAPPSGQSADVAGGYYTSLSVAVTLQNGSDALSGIDSSSGIVERQSATLSGGSCSSWSGGWTAVTLVGGADTSVAADRCYRYRYLISDNVGNQSVASLDSNVAKIDVDAPATGDDAPAGWRNAAVTVTLSPADSGSGVASTVYRVDGGSFVSGISISIPAPADHSNDGVHTIEFRSTDAAGNVEPLRTASVRIDTTLPTTTDDAPAGWSSSPVTVTLSPADALSGIASTQYRVDGGAFQGGISVAIPAPADHSNDGVHTIEYRSTDNAGNVEPLGTATVRIDTTLPSGALTAPADGTRVNGPVPISATAGDVPSGVASVEFLVRPNGSGSFTSISTDTTAPYDANWDSTGAPEGNAELKVVVVDNAGLSVTSAIRTIVVDNPPAPTLDDPGANLAGSVTLNAASQPDTAQVVFERSPVGAGTWTQIATDTSAPFSADFDTSAIGDGQYDLRAIATDLGGFGGTSPLRGARVDNTAPTVSVSDPAGGAVVGGPNVHIAGLATDLGSGVASVRFEQRPAGGGAFTAIGTDTAAPFEASWDTTGLSGNFELRAVATDAAGNPATAAIVPLIVDSSVASVTLEDAGALLRGVVNLSASAPSASVASVDFERRPAGGTWTRIVLDTARPWGAAFDTKSLDDGVYDLRAQALNTSGQVLATHSRESVRVDNTAPTMLSATPADGSVVSSVTSITLVASEPVASVQGATIDGAAATAEISGANVTFSTSSLGAGAHALTGSLVDAAGNSGAFSVSFTVKVKAHATLILRVSKPTTKSRGNKRVFLVPLTLSTPARVNATLLSPTGRRLRTLRTDLSAGRHSLRFILPAASLPPGRYTILVVATASDGSKVVKRISVTIAGKKATVKKGTETSTPTPTKKVVIPVAPSPRGDDNSATPPAKTSKPESKKQAPRAKSRPLETASGYVSSKPRRTAGLVVVLLALGAGIAFLIKIEMGRMLGSPRR